MGRFYKATPRNFIDNIMFKTPFEEIAATIGTLDRNIDETYDEGIAIQDSLDSEMLESDDPAVQERYKYYNDIAESSAAAMDKNPLSFIKHRGKLRRASRELSTEMKSGLIGRADEQLESYNKDVAELSKRKDISEETKELKKRHILHQYEQAGSLKFDPETGTFNKISDFNTALDGEILDENKYLTEIDQGFQYQSEGFGSVKGGKIEGTDRDMIITSKSSKTTRSAKRVQSFITADLDQKGYVKSREQVYQMQLDMGEMPQVLNKNGSLMTPKELAEKDKQNLILKGVEKLTGSKGQYTQTATVVPGQGAYNKGGFNTAPIGIQINDVSSTLIPKTQIAARTKTDKKLEEVFNFDSNKAATSNPDMLEIREKLLARGFTTPDQMVSSTLENYSDAKLENLAGGLLDAGLIPNGLEDYEYKTLAEEYLNSKAPQNAIVTKIIPNLPEVNGEKVEPTTDQVNEATKEITRMINHIDQSQVVGEVWVTVDGESTKLPSGTTFSSLATNKEGYTYINPTGYNKATKELAGNDSDGYQIGGVTVVADKKDAEGLGITKGSALTIGQIAQVRSSSFIKGLDTKSVPGSPVYNNTDNLIKVDPNTVKQEVYTTVKNGFKTEQTRYTGSVSVLRVSTDGEKKLVLVKMILDPKDYTLKWD
jgi:hypothetical protein